MTGSGPPELPNRPNQPDDRPVWLGPLFFLTQQLTCLISINFIFPALLATTWQTSLIKQAMFLIVYSLTYPLMAATFAALMSFFGIAMAFIPSVGKVKRGEIDSSEAARSLAENLISSSQPSWMLALAPAFAALMAVTIGLVVIDTTLLESSADALLKAAALHTALAYAASLPFVLKLQAQLDSAVKAQIEKRNRGGSGKS